MELKSVFGLPAHPLLVHAAVVLVPLAVLGFIATGWRRAWRERYGLLVVYVAAGGSAFSFLAAQSGPPLRQQLRDVAAAVGQPGPQFGDHSDLGTVAAFLAFSFAIAVAAFFALDRWTPEARKRRWPFIAAFAATSVLGLLTVLWMVRAGHSGAELVWGA